MIDLAAILASTILLGLAIFQILLINGKPFGKYAWGGQHNVLPVHLRIASASSVLLYALFAVLILNQAEIINVLDTQSWAYTAIKVVTGYFFVGIVMNGISRSKPERLLMTPIATILALLFLYVTLSIR